MEKFSKKILVALLTLFLMPQSAFAAWWNPSTWFSKDRTPTASQSAKNFASSTSEQPYPNRATGNRKETKQTATASLSVTGASSEIQKLQREIEKRDTEIQSLKNTVKELQRNLAIVNPRCESIVIEKPVERVVVQDKIVEKPIEKIVYRDRVVEKLVEKVVYQDRVIEKPIERVVYQERVVEKPIEKIVYKDRIIQESCDIPAIPGPISTPTPTPMQVSPADLTPTQNEIYPLLKKYSDTNGGCRNQSGYNKLPDHVSGTTAICGYWGGNIKVGQQIKIEAAAIPSKNSSVILYRFDATEGGKSNAIKDWSEESSVEYVVPNIPYSWVGFTIAVKNDYSTRREGNYDDYIQIRYEVIP